MKSPGKCITAEEPEQTTYNPPRNHRILPNTHYMLLLLLPFITVAAQRQPQRIQPAKPAPRPETWADSIPVASDEVGPLSERFVFVEGGTFNMGSPDNELGREDDENQHGVTLSSFYISEHEVTQAQYQSVMDHNPAYFKENDRPVEMVSWYDAVEFCNALSLKEGRTPAYTINGEDVSWNRNAHGYRLPTEAEWEYAARGGKRTLGYRYSGSNNVDAVGWYDDTSGGRTHTVGTKRANELGLYDMSGNVYEWCWDWYGVYPSERQTNPVGPTDGSYRVRRGGSWNARVIGIRVANRGLSSPDYRHINLGFRLALSIR